MNKLIGFLVFSISTYAFGTATDSDCDCTPPGLPQEDGVKFVQNLTSELSQIDVRVMSAELCLILTKESSLDKYSAAENLEETLLRFSSISRISPNYKLQLANFWNKHSESIICEANSGLFPRQHLFKRAIQMNVQDKVLVDYFLSDENKFPINMNVIEVLNDGEKSTILDYIDKVIAEPDANQIYNIGQVIGIKNIIEKLYNGKRAKEL
ncbi:hypothetical protein [Aurantiacibacter rhizosphaerae]|uniref:Uncharacterized protein n=1 Tax=Aurantiacibacter rhizosphaerae TaxID=2691582 RepID=A0A844XH89_9SPHN|nr:hypothetical protein [Aurantiacibacter rhizosphaerae]MWV29200.1 hypothetical protein [Aurantiacibacter rhizosphaerae]